MPRRLLAAGAIAFLLPLGACALEKSSITYATTGVPTFHGLPLVVAMQRGYFADEGLKVELSEFAGGSRVAQAVVGASADVGMGGFEYALQLQPKGITLKNVVVTLRYPAIAIGVGKAHAAAYRSPGDLKGLKVGVSAPGSQTHYGVNRLLAKAGLNGSDVSIIGLGAPPSALAAVRAGKVDVLSYADPVMTVLEAQGDLKIVADARTTKGTLDLFGVAYPGGAVYVMDEFARANPTTVQAVANAMVRALKWLHTASASDIARLVPVEYLKEDRALYFVGFAKFREAYSPDGLCTDAAAEMAQKALIDGDPKLAQAKLRWKDAYDNRYALAAQSRKP